MNLKKSIQAMAILLSCLLIYSGCSNENTIPQGEEVSLIRGEQSQGKPELDSILEEEADKTIVTVGDKKISYSQVMIYVQYVKTKYEESFGPSIWDYNFGGQTFEEIAKEEIMNMITQTSIISSKYETHNIVLTEEEEHEITLLAEKFLEGLSKEEVARHGFNMEEVERFYRDNKLYERVYDAESMMVDTEVSNEEARQVHLNYIYLSTLIKGEDESFIPMPETDKLVVLKKAEEIRAEGLELIHTMVEEDEFESYAKGKSQRETVSVIYGKNNISHSFGQEGMDLRTKELSQVIEKEDGYYILYSVTDYHREATLEIKEEIISERQNKAFKETYKKWVEKEEVKIKEDLWNEIRLSNTI